MVGTLLVICGIAALIFPVLSTLATTIVLSWLLIFSGILLIVHAFRARTVARSLWSGLIGLAWLSGGVLTLVYPVLGSVSFTIAFVAVFLVQGGLELVGAWTERTEGGLGWRIFSASIAIAAGLLIVLGLPTSALWVLGVITGVNFLATGVSYIVGPPSARAA